MVVSKPIFKKATMGEYLKNPHLDVSPFRKARVEYPFYDKNSLNKEMEKFVKEATPRKFDKSFSLNPSG
jgi:hypothetical protein